MLAERSDQVPISDFMGFDLREFTRFRPHSPFQFRRLVQVRGFALRLWRLAPWRRIVYLLDTMVLSFLPHLYLCYFGASRGQQRSLDMVPLNLTEFHVAQRGQESLLLNAT